MATPPQHPNAGLTAAPPVPISIRVGDEDGNAPGDDDLVEYLRLLYISRSAGGGELDRAVFAYDLDKAGVRLVDVETVVGWNRQVEVRGFGDTGDDDGDAMFWGDLVVCDMGINPQGESATVQAVLAPYLFGDMILGPKVRDPLISPQATVLDPDAIVDHDSDVVFNPLYDGDVRFNRSAFSSDFNNRYVWLYPESVDNLAAESFQNETATEWLLEASIDALQWTWNRDEEFITNFDAAGSKIFDEAPEVKNVRIRRGVYLPQALDELLYPLGYNWFVDFSLVDTADPGDGSDHTPVWEMKKTIVVFKRGEGPEKQLYFQRPGEAFDAAKSNVPDVGVTWDIADLANTIEAHGSYEEREVTLELYRAWDEQYDTYKADDLDAGDPDSDYNAPNSEVRDVHRVWAANEDGGLGGLRGSTSPAIPDPPDLRDVFTNYVPKRRRLLPCLTYNDPNERQRRAVYVEWWNPDADGDEKWEPVPSEWGYVVLTEQIGIRFTKRTPPAELVEAGDDARIRVTGTLIGDRRLNTFSTTSGDSPNSRDVKLFLDVSDRFHDRKRQDEGTYKSIFAATTLPADEAEDLSKLQDFVDNLAAFEEPAALDATFNLHGIHFDYKIGDLITKIDGRNISLNRNSEASDNKKYLQVTGVIWNYQRQQTILRTEASEAYVQSRRDALGLF